MKTVSVNGSEITMYQKILSIKIFISQDIIIAETDIVSDRDTILRAEVWTGMRYIGHQQFYLSLNGEDVSHEEQENKIG
jgi:hypothetical protein